MNNRRIAFVRHAVAAHIALSCVGLAQAVPVTGPARSPQAIQNAPSAGQSSFDAAPGTQPLPGAAVSFEARTRPHGHPGQERLPSEDVPMDAMEPQSADGPLTGFVTAVPEPSTWVLLIAGLVAIGLLAWRRSTSRD